MSLALVTSLAAALAAAPAADNAQLFDQATRVCALLVLNPQQLSEADLSRAEQSYAEQLGFSKDMVGWWAARTNQGGLATLYFQYGGGECTVGVSRDLHTPDLQGLADLMGQALKVTFDHSARDRWTSPLMTISYEAPGRSDPDHVAYVRFARGG